jgi:hypothetical protein
MPTNGQFAVGELVTASDANTLFMRGYQNRIINGAFVINQRGYASGANLASGAYGFDRWKSGFTNTALTFTAGSQSTTVTISTSGVLQQIVERENMPAGQYVLSWSGTATGRVYNVGGTPPAYGASPQIVTLDGSANVVVEFTASGSTKTLGTVQLEAGPVFSPFEFRHRGDEIFLCQRYYYQVRNPRLTGTSNNNPARMALDLPTNFRASPTVGWTGTADVFDGGNIGQSNTATLVNATISVVEIDFNTSGGTPPAVGRCTVFYTGGPNNSAIVSASAEL